MDGNGDTPTFTFRAIAEDVVDELYAAATIFAGRARAARERWQEFAPAGAYSDAQRAQRRKAWARYTAALETLLKVVQGVTHVHLQVDKQVGAVYRDYGVKVHQAAVERYTLERAAGQEGGR